MSSRKLYYEYPYMKSFKAHVLSCSESNGAYEIRLQDTAFYPDGGGQPADTGLIGISRITHVYEGAGGIIHIGDKPLTEGCDYDSEIDWERRFDHMQHHSAEHLVSGIIHKLYEADNVGFNIGETYVTIDFNKELSKEDARNIEALANEAVYKNLPLKVDYFDGVPPFGYRSKKELSGTIRIVTIDDYDICACAGTQLERTGEIGLIKIISVQKYKSGSRLYLLCGLRALKDYQVKEDNIAAISALFSCKPYESAEYAERFYEERETLKFELIRTQNALIDMKTAELAPCDKLLIFEDNLSSEQMKRYISNLLEKAGTIAVFSGSEEEGYSYMITSALVDIPDFVKNMNKALNGKGGGKGVAGGYVRANKTQIENYFNNI